MRFFLYTKPENCSLSLINGQRARVVYAEPQKQHSRRKKSIMISLETVGAREVHVVEFIILIYRINTRTIITRAWLSIAMSKSVAMWKKSLQLSDENVCTYGKAVEGKQKGKAIKRTIVARLNHIKNCSLCNFPFPSFPSVSTFGSGRKTREKCKFEGTFFYAGIVRELRKKQSNNVSSFIFINFWYWLGLVK